MPAAEVRAPDANDGRLSPTWHHGAAVRELELTRAPGDRRLYRLADLGTIRLKGWGSRAARVEAMRERYALADGEHELAVFEGKGWGRRPVKVTADDPAALDPGLLLFAAFLVRRLAEDAGAAAAATSAGT